MRLNSRFFRRTLWLVFLLAHVVSAKSKTAQAQVIDLDVSQSVTWIYGQSLTFTATTRAPTSLVGARLIFQMADTAEYRSPVEIARTVDVSATHTATVEELSLPTAANFQYYWEFEDANGQMYRSVPVTDLYADNRVPWTWMPSNEGTLTVLTDGSNQGLARSALAMGAAGQSVATQLLGQSNENEITIFVYPTLSAMANSLRAHRLNIEDWVAAYTIPNQQIIFVAAEAGPGLMASLERDIRHEMLHLAIRDAAGAHFATVPGWFNEGLAIYASGDPDPGLDAAMSEALANRILPSLNQHCIKSFASLPPREATLAYAQSASVIAFIIERYGVPKIAELMTAFGQGLDCTQGVESALGVSLSELETQWLRNLSTREEVRQAESSSPFPWLIGWVASVILALLFIAPQPLPINERMDSGTRVSLPPIGSNPS